MVGRNQNYDESFCMQALFLKRKPCSKNSQFLLTKLLLSINCKLNVILTLHRDFDIIGFHELCQMHFKYEELKLKCPKEEVHSRRGSITWIRYKNKTQIWIFSLKHSLKNVLNCMLIFTSSWRWRNPNELISIHIWIEKSHTAPSLVEQSSQKPVLVFCFNLT